MIEASISGISKQYHKQASGEKLARGRRFASGSKRPMHHFIVAAIVLMFGDLNVFFPSSRSEARADQPVHCLRGQLYGVWHFYVSDQQDTVDLFKVSEVCTHQLPNKLQVIGPNH